MGMGIDPKELGDEDLLREIGQLHQTRTETLLHGSDDALRNHNQRMSELEAEYLRRYPQRHIDAERLREGARQRG